MRTLAIASLAMFVACSGAAAQQGGETAIFDGKTLAGWKQLGGKAKYEVVDGAIVGTSVPNTENSFLCTEKTYGDFILDVDLKVDAGLNSGIQIRSNSWPQYQNGRVHGYQVEIDPSPRAFSGGVYDEARRGWLNDLKDNEAARKAFKPDDWNHYRVEAIADSIKTWVNGVPAADMVDSMDLTGFIGLQVHGVGKETKPMQVRWKNIKLRDLGRRTWVSIFDGKTLAGWRPTPGGTWEVKEGAILGRSPKEEKNHGLLMTDKRFKDFTVRFKFKSVKGNSGFYFRVDKVDSPVTVNGFQAEVEPGFKTGGLYETGGRAWVATTNEEEMKKIYKPGEWTDMTVSARGRRIAVHVNNRKTAELKDDPGRLEGNIALQLHGGDEMEVWFKDIEVLSEPE